MENPSNIRKDSLVIKQMIKDGRVKSIAILSHNSPDDDAVGSMKALEEFLLKTINKKVDIILQTKADVKYKSILGEEMVNKVIMPKRSHYDLAIVLDTGDINMTYGYVEQIATKIIVIDHHEKSNIKSDVYINYNDCSTGMTLLKLFGKELLFDNIPTYLGLTIIADTDSFKNKNVSRESFDMMGILLEYGCDLDTINTLYNNFTFSYMKLLSLTLGKIQRDKVTKTLYLIITQDDIENANSSVKESGRIINMLKLMPDINMAILLIESKNDVIVRFRSNKINCDEIASELGGGGHKYSSAAIIINSDIYDVKDQILEAIKHLMF